MKRQHDDKIKFTIKNERDLTQQWVLDTTWSALILSGSAYFRAMRSFDETAHSNTQQIIVTDQVFKGMKFVLPSLTGTIDRKQRDFKCGTRDVCIQRACDFLGLEFKICNDCEARDLCCNFATLKCDACEKQGCQDHFELIACNNCGCGGCISDKNSDRETLCDFVECGICRQSGIATYMCYDCSIICSHKDCPHTIVCQRHAIVACKFNDRSRTDARCFTCAKTCKGCKAKVCDDSHLFACDTRFHERGCTQCFEKCQTCRTYVSPLYARHNVDDTFATCSKCVVLYQQFI